MINYFQKYRTRKYLMRIILSINILIVSFMLLALLAAYLYSEKISLQTQREANDKVLSQINYNISFMNETVQNFAISFFYDNDMARLLYNEETDDMEDIIRKNKMDKIISYNSFVHSIVIYNNKQRGYSVNGEYSVKNEDSNLVAILNDYLDGRKQIYKMELMPVTFIPDLKHPDRTQEVFSLFMYDSLTGYNKSESALIINIKSEWLFQKMKMMNGISSNGSNRILIFDQKKEAYSPIDHRDLDLDDLKREVYRHIDSSQKQVSQFTYSSSGEKQIVNYMINPATHWVIVDIEPYIAVLDTVNKLKIAFIVVGAVCVVLAIFASLFVSNKLYSPLDHLVKQTKRLRDHDSESLLNKDEISYMSHIYTHLIDQLMKEQTKHEGNENIIRSYYLRKLITDSPTFSAHELKECMEKNYLRVNLKNGAILGVLKIDGQGRGFGKEQRFDLKLLYFAISNIMTELIVEHSAALTGEVVDILGEHLVLIFDAGEDPTKTYAPITDLLKRANTVVNSYYHITFTVALSEFVPDSCNITYHYEEALDHQLYRMNFGGNTVITPLMVKHNLENGETQIPIELEEKLIEAIKMNNQKLVLQELGRIREVIAGMGSDSVFQSVIHLSIIIKQTIREINANRLSPVSINLRSIDRLVFERETLEELFAEFSKILSGIFVDQKQMTENRDHVLVDTVKDVIRANYHNANLSLQDIAGMLKMSPAYVGRIFKKHENLSIAEYMNEIRLMQSLLLLEQHNLPVNEVAERVGFNTQSYFFKMFRKRFGTTPKEYRTKKSLT